jgi:hypothetical protein
MRSASRRLAEPMESMAQTVAKRATELVVDSIDMNAVLGQIDLNKLLDQIDLNRVLDRVDIDRIVSRLDMDAVLNRVDVNTLVDRIDMAEVLDRSELSAILSRSSTTIFSEGIDLARSQAVGLDNFIARWVNRLLGRGTKRPPAPVGPPRMLDLAAQRLVSSRAAR